MTPVPTISDVDLAFPAKVDWIPMLGEIPLEFHSDSAATKQARFFRAVFYGSGEDRVITNKTGLLPKPGVDAAKAWRALQVVLATFAIKHERKEAAFAFLCAEWFADIRWETKKGTVVTFEDVELDRAWCAKG